MARRFSTLALLFVPALLLLHPPLAAAQTGRGRLDALAGSTTEVYVTMSDGLERRGRVVSTDEAGMRITFAGTETLVPWSRLVTVEQRGDPIWDGALKGAGIATALYGAVAIAGGARADDVLPFVGSAALAWGAVGAVIDAFNVGRHRVFVAALDEGGPARDDVRRVRRPRGVVIGGRVVF